MSVIENGAGDGKKAKVDQDNRLHTHAITETANEEASGNGDAYNVNTGTITLTTANETTCLYFKNNQAAAIHVTTIGFLIGNSTGGSGDMDLRIDKGSNGGTIISNESVVSVLQNKNVNSSKTIDVTAYKGVEGDNCTGGTALYRTLLAGAARPYLIASGNVVIEAGGTICVKVTPQTGNTSMGIQIFLGIIEYNLT